MSKKKNDGKKLPAYRIFSVTKEGDKKPVWFELGAAFLHSDKKGLSLQFRANALPGADIVLREPLPPKQDETEA
ncbi:MAG: hypothetical protein WDM81_19495 [Rhizomicrobium sp.]